MKPQNASGVVIAGGGWAGLAAAVELARHDIPVTLYESAKQLGGRARCVRFGDSRVDNGQHLMIGAYTAMLEMMRTIGLDESEMFLRQPLDLVMLSANTGNVRMRAPRLPAPLHLLIALLGARGLSLGDKLHTIRFWLNRTREGFGLAEDISVSELFRRTDQPARMVQAIWNPLCIAILNTPPGEASARLFLRVLDQAFNKARGHSDLLLPRTDLGYTLPEPAARFVENHAGQIHLSRRITAVTVQHDQIASLQMDDKTLEVEHLILATPPHITRRLLERQEAAKPLCHALSAFRNEPIVTVYLRYPEQVRMPQALVGGLDGLSQWVFDRRLCNQPGLMAVVISGEGPHTALNQATLSAIVARELAAMYPDWPEPLDTLVIRERRATLASVVGIEARRPANKTPIRGLWLAGDYTNTGLPATLEGAIRSGQACARQLLDTLG